MQMKAHVAFGLVLALSACAGPLPMMYDKAGQPQFSAEQAQTTDQSRALRAVPPPERKLTVSVFEMPDMSGQYKESNTGQNLSRAVTQGGADILIKALLEAADAAGSTCWTALRWITCSRNARS